MLAVVIAGLLLGHKAPVLQTRAVPPLASGSTGRPSRSCWRTPSSCSSGCRSRGSLDDVGNAPSSRPAAPSRSALAVLVGGLVLRPVWMFPSRYSPVRPGPDADRPRAGRGVHASCSLGRHARGGHPGRRPHAPGETPPRVQLVVIALVVTVGTLLLQGSTLPWLARRSTCAAPTPARTRSRRPPCCSTTVAPGCGELDECADERRPDHGRRCDQRVGSGSTRAGSGWAARPRRRGDARARPYRRVRTEMIRRRARRAAAHPRPRRGRPRGARARCWPTLDVEESMLDRRRTTRASRCARRRCCRPSGPAAPATHLATRRRHVQARRRRRAARTVRRGGHSPGCTCGCA